MQAGEAMTEPHLGGADLRESVAGYTMAAGDGQAFMRDALEPAVTSDVSVTIPSRRTWGERRSHKSTLTAEVEKE